MFWYLGQHQNFSQKNEVKAVQNLFNSQLEILAQIEILEIGHHITFFNKNKAIGSEFLGLKWQIDEEPGLSFQSQQNLYMQDEGWEIFITEFSPIETEGALEQRYSLSSQINEKDLVCINWLIRDNDIVFVTLHTDRVNNLSIWTRTEYKILSEKPKSETSNKKSPNKHTKNHQINIQEVESSDSFKSSNSKSKSNDD